MKNLFHLTSKVALVTGASSGMGKAIAEAMAAHGATVVISSNDEEGCKQVAESLRKEGCTAHAVVCNVAKKEDIENLYKEAIKKAGKIDILVSCVGMALPGSLLDINANNFETTFAINLQSAILLSQLVLPQMAEQKDGALIFLGSISGVRGNKNISLYGLSKAGLIQLARNIAVEYGALQYTGKYNFSGCYPNHICQAYAGG